MNEPNFEDRRKSPRIDKHFIVIYYDTNFPDQTYCTTQLKNLSSGGMLLITEMSFDPGTILGLEIKSPMFANISGLKGEVLQSHESAKEIFYHTRLKFTNLTPQSENLIKESVKFFQADQGMQNE